MNWYKKIKIADQYGVMGAYGYWIDPNGQTLNVEDQMHRAAIAKAGWLNFQNPAMDIYEAAAQQNIIRVMIWNNEINFDGGGNGSIHSLTPKQKEVMHDMFLEYKVGNRDGGAYINNIGGMSQECDTVQQFDEFLASIPAQAQASSTKQKKLAKKESVFNHQLHRMVDYLVNPTKQEIVGFINKIEYENQSTEFRKAAPQIRGVFIDGDLYVWDGWATSHCVFCKGIGKGCDDLGCYDMDDSDPSKFQGDALTFMLDKEGNLITNIPQQHPEKEYFRNKLEPYKDPREEYNDEDPDFWTHKWE